jgi:hypothetical protein
MTMMQETECSPAFSLEHKGCVLPVSPEADGTDVVSVPLDSGRLRARFAFQEPSMPQPITAALPIGVSTGGAVDIKAVARLDTEGKTVNQVFSELSRFLSKTELEPEWLCLANMLDDANEAVYGARHSRLWPESFSHDRISVSVCTGNSEGWIIHVDWISRRPLADSFERKYSVMPLLRAKVFSSDHAWTLARLLSRLIDAS